MERTHQRYFGRSAIGAALIGIGAAFSGLEAYAQGDSTLWEWMAAGARQQQIDAKTKREKAAATALEDFSRMQNARQEEAMRNYVPPRVPKDNWQLLDTKGERIIVFFNLPQDKKDKWVRAFDDDEKTGEIHIHYINRNGTNYMVPFSKLYVDWLKKNDRKTYDIFKSATQKWPKDLGYEEEKSWFNK